MSFRLGRSMMLAATCAAVAVLTTPRPALACICYAPDLGTALRRADAVFVGTRVSNTTPFGPYADGIGVAVDTVWKGDVPASVLFVAGDHDPSTGQASASTCYFSGFSPGEPTLFFATMRDGYFESWSCSGTGSWRDGNKPSLFDPLVARLGPGAPPDRAVPTHAPPSGVPNALAGGGDEGAENDPARSPWTNVVGIGLLTALAAIVIRGWTRRP